MGDTAFERLSSQAGVEFIDKLPESVKSTILPKAFKCRLKLALITEALFSRDGIMAHNWYTY